MNDRDGTGPESGAASGGDAGSDDMGDIGSDADVDAGADAETGGDADAGAGADGGSDADADADADVGSEPLPTDDPSEEGEWKFSLQDIRRREAEAEARAEAVERRRQPLEPGDPTLEGAVFVLLGVLFTLFVLSRLVVG